MLRIAFPLALLIACSSAGPDAAPGADARATSDASGPVVDAASEPDADRGDCLPQVPVDYGTPPVLDTTQSESSGSYSFFAELVDEPFQRLFISLHPGQGVFPGAVTPGNYVIEGEDTDYQWCGACIFLAVDDGDTPSTLYMAESAKLQLDTVGSEIHGELTAATLRQIDIEFTGVSCEGGGEWPCGNTGCSGGLCGVQVEGPPCTTYIESLTF